MRTEEKEEEEEVVGSEGAVVRLHGLQARPELNGKVGICVAAPGSDDRCAVELSDGRVLRVKPLTSAQLLRRSRSVFKRLGEQLDRRLVYGHDCRELVASHTFKQRGVGVSSWEWCRGAIETLVGKQSLSLDDLPLGLREGCLRHPHHHSARHQERSELVQLLLKVRGPVMID